MLCHIAVTSNELSKKFSEPIGLQFFFGLMSKLMIEYFDSKPELFCMLSDTLYILAVNEPSPSIDDIKLRKFTEKLEISLHKAQNIEEDQLYSLKKICEFLPIQKHLGSDSRHTIIRQSILHFLDGNAAMVHFGHWLVNIDSVILDKCINESLGSAICNNDFQRIKALMQLFNYYSDVSFNIEQSFSLDLTLTNIILLAARTDEISKIFSEFLRTKTAYAAKMILNLSHLAGAYLMKNELQRHNVSQLTDVVEAILYLGEMWRFDSSNSLNAQACFDALISLSDNLLIVENEQYQIMAGNILNLAGRIALYTNSANAYTFLQRSISIISRTPACILRVSPAIISVLKHEKYQQVTEFGNLVSYFMSETPSIAFRSDTIYLLEIWEWQKLCLELHNCKVSFLMEMWEFCLQKALKHSWEIECYMSKVMKYVLHKVEAKSIEHVSFYLSIVKCMLCHIYTNTSSEKYFREPLVCAAQAPSDLFVECLLGVYGKRLVVSKIQDGLLRMHLTDMGEDNMLKIFRVYKNIRNDTSNLYHSTFILMAN